jgi:hypothetical protein
MRDLLEKHSGSLDENFTGMSDDRDDWVDALNNEIKRMSQGKLPVYLVVNVKAGGDKFTVSGNGLRLANWLADLSKGGKKVTVDITGVLKDRNVARKLAPEV